MGVLRWLTRNRAETRTPTHSDLAPLAVAVPPEQTVQLVRRAVAGRLSRWTVVSSGPGRLELTRATRLFRFIDDVRLTFEPGQNGTTLVHAESCSRVGVGDLGQNRRNILQLWSAIRDEGVNAR